MKLPSEPPPVAASAKLEAELGSEPAGEVVEPDGSGLALHRGAVDAAGDGELAGGIGTLEAAEEAGDAGGVAGAGDADVDLGPGVLGDDVGAGAAADDTGVYGEAGLRVGEGGDLLEQAREFEDGGVAAVEVEAGVGGDAADLEAVVADAFAGGLAGEALRGLEDEDGGGLSGEALGDGAGDRAADLFVGVEEEGDGAAETDVAEDADGGEGHRDAGLHVEDAGAVDSGVFAAGLAPGHGFEGAERPDGVEVAEEEDWFVLCAGAGAEAELEDVAEVLLFVLPGAPAEGFGLATDEGGGSVDGGLGVARGLDLDQLAKEGFGPDGVPFGVLED